MTTSDDLDDADADADADATTWCAWSPVLGAGWHSWIVHSDTELWLCVTGAAPCMEKAVAIAQLLMPRVRHLTVGNAAGPFLRYTIRRDGTWHAAALRNPSATPETEPPACLSCFHR